MDNVLIYDIETMKEAFVLVAHVPGEHVRTWEVSKWKNNLDSLVKFIEEHKDYWWVGYNNLRFDAQVVEWILRNNQQWIDLTREEIVSRIYQKAQDVIDDSNYDVFPEYAEKDLTIKQIDLFRIHHYDNKNRLVSLKRLEFEMDLENIEEMPIPHDKVGLTRQDVVTTIGYCKNDVRATYAFYLVTIGETEHPLYKGNNQIELRQDIEAEFGIYCMNYSDSKIGDEMIKKFYCEEKSIQYAELPKKGIFRKEIKVKDCIAPYIAFKSAQLQKFLLQIRKRTMKQTDEFLESINLFGNTYTFAKGGLHTVNGPKIFTAGDGYLIIDWDVSSYYPAIIINNGRFPAHLGRAFLKGYERMFNRRLELKPLAKKDRRIRGIVNALKLAVNSVYGKSSDMSNWMFDRLLTMFTTITGELSLMMLIEAYELAGIHVISANTDGVTVRIHESMLQKMEEINKWWMDLTRYELERTDYSKIIFSTVNDYLAIKTDGEIKKKGDFLTDFELHKNKSARVVPLALERYFVGGIDVSDSIRSHGNIYDFAMRQKASKYFHYEGLNRETGKKSVYHKLIRYYVSKKGEKLLKIKNPNCPTNANPITQVDAGEWVATVCNKLPPNHPLDNIEHNYYIERANRILLKILYEGRRHKQIDLNQLKLF